MRRLAVPALVLSLVLVFAACQESRSPRRPRGSGSSGPSPTASGATAPVGGSCTLVIGFSVTTNWFRDGAFEQQPGIDDASWEVLAHGGHDVWLWSDPNLHAYSVPPDSLCGREPDRIVFQVAAERSTEESLDDVVGALRMSIANFQARWPTANVVVLIPIVGGPDGQPCPADTRGGAVGASVMNPLMNDVIAEVADGAEVVAGPDLLLEDCSQYADGKGHLTEEGSRYIASALAEHFAA
jgi:hypothetical protein